MRQQSRKTASSLASTAARMFAEAMHAKEMTGAPGYGLESMCPIEDDKLIAHVHMEFRMDRTLKAVKGSLNVTIPRHLADALGWKKGDRIAFSRTTGGLAMTTTASVLRTVGYEGHTLDSFVGLLRRAGIKQLLDIRDLPLSRRKGFSKTPLSIALMDAGIGYEHVRDLGAPKNVRAPYVSGVVTHSTFKRAYLEHLDRHRAALSGVKWHMDHAVTAIMCVERNHAECHRGIVAEELHKEGVAVEHL